MVFFIGHGLLFSLVSQTIFAYLFIYRFGLGIFRSFLANRSNGANRLFVFDVVYFPYQNSEGKVSLFIFMLIAAGILLYGVVIAKIKASQTKQSAFIPALSILMVVMTIIEWVPGLRTSGTDYAWFIIVALLLCYT